MPTPVVGQQQNSKRAPKTSPMIKGAFDFCFFFFFRGASSSSPPITGISPGSAACSLGAARLVGGGGGGGSGSGSGGVIRNAVPQPGHFTFFPANSSLTLSCLLQSGHETISIGCPRAGKRINTSAYRELRRSYLTLLSGIALSVSARKGIPRWRVGLTRGIVPAHETGILGRFVSHTEI